MVDQDEKDIITGNEFPSVDDEHDPDEDALCKCGHPKHEHRMGPSWECTRADCICTDFAYAE